MRGLWWIVEHLERSIMVVKHDRCSLTKSRISLLWWKLVSNKTFALHCNPSCCQKQFQINQIKINMNKQKIVHFKLWTSCLLDLINLCIGRAGVDYTVLLLMLFKFLKVFSGWRSVSVFYPDGVCVSVVCVCGDVPFIPLSNCRSLWLFGFLEMYVT
jgi:hypothetical protein